MSKNIKSDLASFYSKEAKKYYETRQKPWPDFEHLLSAIQKLKLPKPRILELGCGGGRFLSHFSECYKGDFEYCGVDMSEGLLAYAQKDAPNQTFVCDDMLHFLSIQEQESWDIIIACASFQHLPNEKERQKLMHYAYRALKYDGLCLMTNRAFSEWFLKKYRKALLNALFTTLVSLGKKNWRDVFIPRKSGKQEKLRYYHLFSLTELGNLLKNTGFLVQALYYLDKKGKLTPHRRSANNSFFSAKKTIFSK